MFTVFVVLISTELIASGVFRQRITIDPTVDPESLVRQIAVLYVVELA
jgi:hypothetical protein